MRSRYLGLHLKDQHVHIHWIDSGEFKLAMERVAHITHRLALQMF